MRSLLITILIIQNFVCLSQYASYSYPDPVSKLSNALFIKNQKIIILVSESQIGSKLQSISISYFDSLGRIVCYDNFDSSGKVYYTGNYFYDGYIFKAKKFIGIHHLSGKSYTEEFYRLYKNGNLVKDSSNKMLGTNYYEYDSLGREIKCITKFHNSNHFRTIYKGYLGNTNNLLWQKDIMSRGDIKHLDSHVKYYYDEALNLIEELELASNDDETSNSNRGSLCYIYNNHGLVVQKEERGIHYIYEYSINGLLSNEKVYLKKYGQEGDDLISERKFKYLFY
jgi:hypothetical protein